MLPWPAAIITKTGTVADTVIVGVAVAGVIALTENQYRKSVLLVPTVTTVAVITLGILETGNLDFVLSRPFSSAVCTHVQCQPCSLASAPGVEQPVFGPCPWPSLV